MEILAAIALIALLYALYRSHVNEQKRLETFYASPPAEKSKPATPQPEPFDSGTAQPSKAPTRIIGPAYIVDGDTIRIKKTQIRLFGVDAPEMNHPHGRNAKWALHKLCNGHEISAEVTATDDHGRTVAKCSLPDGTDLSAALVEQGLALDWPKFSGGKYKHLEPEGVRKKLWLADARQKGRMHVWEKYEARQAARTGATPPKDE